MRRTLLLLTLSVVTPAVLGGQLTNAASPAKSAATNSLEERRKALSDLLNEQWEYTLAHNPEQASAIGDTRFNDKLTDFSQSAIEGGIADAGRFLQRFEAIDPSGLTEQEALNRELIIRQLRDTVGDAALREWEMPVNQIQGVHLDLPQLVNVLSFQSVKDFDDYAARLRGIPRLLDQTVLQMRKGVADGLVLPAYLIEKVASQADAIARQRLSESPFAEPLKTFPTEISAEEQQRIRMNTSTAISEQVLPAYERFAAYVRNEYLPKGRKEVGLWALPDGVKRYETAVRRYTTTELKPEEIHQIGLREVARIEAQMLQIARKSGYRDLPSFRASIKANDSLKTKSREDILERYRSAIAAMEPQLPRFFGHLPKASLTVMPVETFREKESPVAHYINGTPDGSRPGHVMVNTAGFGSSGIGIEATAYHEGVPGHHLQVALAQELPELPPFRQQAFYSAFQEGWGMYAEKLAKEAGGYKDPFSDFGRMQGEVFRSIRLVVDTGMHAKHWSRQQALDYMLAHSGTSADTANIEIDRYIVWPGQALAYKVGELKILELRKRAEKELGSKFDIRAFHDELLGGGALPLNVVERRIDAWIARRRAKDL